MQLEETRKSADDFFQSILTESKFVNWFHGRFSTSRLPPPYALWHEFDHFFFNDDGNVRTEQEYFDAVKASTEKEPSLFKKHDAHAKLFYKACKDAKFTNTRHFRRRETIAKELIEKIMGELGRSADEHNESEENDATTAPSTNRFEWLLDRVNQLRSDVLIIDEVQDLGYFVLELCLLLHRGEVADVAILGDNEQTLDFVEFEWVAQFKRLGAELYDRFKELGHPGWSPDDVFRLSRWANANLSVRVENDGLEQLKIVQRSTSQIVEFNKNSFNTSVYHFEPKNEGTAIIEAGTKAEEKLALLEEKGVNVEAGVFWPNQDYPWTEQKVLEKLSEWSTSPNLIAVVFPNEAIESHFQSLCEKQKIDIETWHPVSIKGLEADIVVVFSPWSIEHTKFPWYSPTDEIKSGTEDAWKHIVNTMEGRPSSTKLLKRIAGQRRRHANVMLSRPILTLVIVDIDHHMTTEDKPTELQLIQAQQPNLENLEHEVNHKIPIGLEVVGDDIRKLDEDTLVGQLKWLSSLIDAKKALRQVVSSSARILNLSEKSNVSEKSDLLPKVQFRLLPLHVIKEYGGLVVQDRLTAMGGGTEDEPTQDLETIWFDLLERFLFHSTFRSSDGKAYDSFPLGPLATEFVDAQHEFYDLSFMLKTEGEGQNFTVLYSQELGQRITEAYEQLVDILARLPTLPEKQTSAVTNFVEASIFPTIHFGETLSSWIQIAKKVQLHSPELKTKPLQEPQNLDNFDKLVRLLCMFKKEWYVQEELDLDSLSKRRGYSKEELSGKFKSEKLRPYQVYHRKSSGRDDPAPTQDSTNIQFWISGREFLIQDTEEFRDAMIELEQNFLRPLSGDEDEVDLSTSPAQIDFLLQLARRSAELGSAAVIEKFITHLVDLNKFAKYEHMTDHIVQSLSQVLPHGLNRHGPETFSRKSFIQHVLNLTEKQFWELKSLFGVNAFDISEVFTEWVLEKTNDRNPLSISTIYQITTLRERLDAIARGADSPNGFDSPDGKLSSLIDTANIDIDWETEIVAFRPYNADIVELTKVLNRLKPEIDSSQTTGPFYKHLLPAAQSYQEEFGFLPKAFIQHVLGLHRTWYHLPNTNLRQKRDLPLDDLIRDIMHISERPLFSDWTGNEITMLVGVFSDHEQTPLALDKRHFNPVLGDTTISPWNVDLIDELSRRAKVNDLVVNKKLFDDIKLKGMGVYQLAKEIILGRQQDRLALYGVSLNQADRWISEFEQDDTDGNPAFSLNPITQYHIRQVIQENRHETSWWDRIFQQIDVEGWMTNSQDIRIAETGAHAIDLKLSRFFGIIRFSQYLRTHLPKKEKLGDKRKERLNNILSPTNLIKTFMQTYRTQIKDIKEDFNRLLTVYTRTINGQITSEIGEINFHLETGLFGASHRLYPLIVGTTDSNQQVNEKQLSDFGFVAAMNELRVQMNRDGLKNVNSRALGKLVETLVVSEDNFSIDKLESTGEQRYWTSINLEGAESDAS